MCGPKHIGWEINGHYGSIFQLISHFMSSSKKWKKYCVEILRVVEARHILSYYWDEAKNTQEENAFQEEASCRQPSTVMNHRPHQQGKMGKKQLKDVKNKFVITHCIINDYIYISFQDLYLNMREFQAVKETHFLKQTLGLHLSALGQKLLYYLFLAGDLSYQCNWSLSGLSGTVIKSSLGLAAVIFSCYDH